MGQTAILEWDIHVQRIGNPVDKISNALLILKQQTSNASWLADRGGGGICVV